MPRPLRRGAAGRAEPFVARVALAADPMLVVGNCVLTLEVSLAA